MGGGQAERLLATTELFDPTSGTFSRAASMDLPRGAGVSGTLLPDGRVLVLGGGPDVGTSAELYDPVAGTFTPTGPTTVARSGFFSATLLPGGRVLIAGGLVPNGAAPTAMPDATATAEVYDPATGTFTAVGQMAAPRFIHAASVLPDGTVLLVGGAHEVRPPSSPVPASDPEIFDPATRTFRATGRLARPRLSPTAVAVDDRVLVLGSMDGFGDDLDTAATTEWFQ